MIKEAKLYQKLKNKKIRCQACSWHCLIAEGETGICGIRQNKNGKLYLLVYGKPTGLQIDPVEKKPLYHFLPGEKVLSFGTFGCNFSCSFCQNWQTSQLTKILKKEIKNKIEYFPLIKQMLEKLETWTPKRIVNFARENNLPMIAYTYNEPAIFFEYAYDTAKLAHKYGLKNIFVSNGFESNFALKAIKPYLDAINIDLKSSNGEFYEKICGAKIEPVLKNIKWCYKNNIWTEVTTLIIPGINDSVDELKQIAEFLVKINKNIPWHISAFYPAYKMLKHQPTSRESLIRAYKIGKKAGLNYVYLGNISHENYENTFCPKCGVVLIKRMGYNINIVNFKNQRCQKCAAQIPGIWR